MRSWMTAAGVGVVMAAGLAGCAASLSGQEAAPVVEAAPDKAPPGADIVVTRDGDVWTADYVFERDAPVWAFIRSSLTNNDRKAWRPEDWRVTTPGVVLERIGNLDVIRAVDGGNVPRRISIVMTPRDHNLEADYGVLKFTDGSVALPTGAFDVFPLPSLEAVQQTPDDLNAFEMSVGTARITWRDRAGPVLFHGERLAQATGEDARTYVLFGKAQIREGERLVTVVDPELPEWIGASIESFGPRVADYYTQRLGAGQTNRPTIMASWKGPTPRLQSMSGSVLPGLIVMSFEGVGQVKSTPDGEAYNRWFIGHESAHFWLGQTVRYERARDSWMTEGGADLMAIRALKTLDPTYDARTELQGEVDDCVRLAVKPVAEAGSRGEHRAYYACGAVFAMTAEAAQKRKTGGDWFDYLKVLIDDNRADGVITRAEWLAQLTAVSGDASLSRDIEALLNDGSADPSAVIASLFQRTGVAFELKDGKLVLS